MQRRRGGGAGVYTGIRAEVVVELSTGGCWLWKQSSCSRRGRTRGCPDPSRLSREPRLPRACMSGGRAVDVGEVSGRG
jgi:hypothetical protein